MPDSRQKAKDKKRGKPDSKPNQGGQDRQAGVYRQDPLQKGDRER